MPLKVGIGSNCANLSPSQEISSRKENFGREESFLICWTSSGSFINSISSLSSESSAVLLPESLNFNDFILPVQLSSLRFENVLFLGTWVIGRCFMLFGSACFLEAAILITSWEVETSGPDAISPLRNPKVSSGDRETHDLFYVIFICFYCYLVWLASSLLTSWGLDFKASIFRNLKWANAAKHARFFLYKCYNAKDVNVMVVPTTSLPKKKH